jgi:hypothetical protein
MTAPAEPAAAAPDAPKARPRWPLYVGCGSLFTLSCCGCLVWAWISGTRTNDEYGPLAQACTGSPVEGAGPFPVPAPRVAGVEHESGGAWRYDGLAAPRDHRAGSRAETNVVLCLEAEEEIEDAPCRFETITFQVNEYRRSHRMIRARIVEAATGRALHAGEIVGDIPECTSGFFVPEEGTEFEGASVTDEQVTAFYTTWLATLAPPPPPPTPPTPPAAPPPAAPPP